MSLLEALEVLVNEYRNEKRGIPIHVMAQYLKSCFVTFENAIELKDAWYEGKPTIDEAVAIVEDATGVVTAATIDTTKSASALKTGCPCPNCGAPLSTGRVCTKCGFETRPVRVG